MHPAAWEDQRLLKQCQVTRARRGGPGGQRRNKVQTAVVITHRPTGLIAEAGERRSPAQNQQVALFRLRLALAAAVREPFTGPDALWESRCQGGRLFVNEEHADFPGLLATALDAIAAAGNDVKTAADALGCTATQLVNLLRKHRPALDLINAGRAHPLR